MPGFIQFLTGIYLFVALVWFATLKSPGAVHDRARVHRLRREVVCGRHGPVIPRRSETERVYVHRVREHLGAGHRGVLQPRQV
jgi:hypothetical protein